MNAICERILYASELTDSDELRSDAEAVCEYRVHPNLAMSKNTSLLNCH
ncbi:MAG: hypothetical protein GDA56_04365 [Hormoscilla sp. GM7CHS1pb]|nr:hypothetical protein [Hormoscilla sp. GM7CHS1pb]